MLPLKALSKQSGDEDLGLGIADSIITKVSQVRQLTVRPTSAVRKYAMQDVDSLQAAQTLKVDSVLDGSVQRSGDRLRVSVNLLRVSDGASLWAESFDLRLTDIFAIQDEVSQQVAARLRLKLSPDEHARLAKRYTASPEAYEHYLKGMRSFDEGTAAIFGGRQLVEAIAQFQKATELDARYALARAHLAYCYAWMALFIEPQNREWFHRYNAEIERAWQLDPDLAEIHVARHEVLWSAYSGFKIEEAIRELQQAQQLNPSIGHSQLGVLYSHLGLVEPAVRRLERALEIDPTSAFNQERLIEHFALTARHQDSIAAAERFSRRPRTLLAYLATNRLDEAEQAVQREGDARANDLLWQSSRAQLLALQGKFREAEA
ncbi:MAG: hypothetical protein ACREU7_04535, partial [Burkholderiales bacterium]